jgi:uncharacterized protein
MKQLAMGCIRLYQLCISPFLGTVCRFTPTCSQYSYEAFQKYGFFQGSWLTFKRLAKCHPWHPGGKDEV